MKIHVVKHLRACTQFQRFCKVSNQVKNSYRVYTSTPAYYGGINNIGLREASPICTSPLSHIHLPGTGENILGQQDLQLEALCESTGRRVRRTGLSSSAAVGQVIPPLLAYL